MAQVLQRRESNIWAWDFFCDRTILFKTLYVFFCGPARQQRYSARCGDGMCERLSEHLERMPFRSVG